MKLHEFIEKKKIQLNNFRNQRIMLYGQKPDEYPLDLEESEWTIRYMTYLASEPEL